MLATLRHEAFSDPAWVYERKLDGIRCLAHRDGDEVELWSRNHVPLGGRFAELVPVLAAQPSARFVVDGELVALEHGATSFSRLQQGGSVELHLFDVLLLGDRDLRPLPLLERKRVLHDAFEFGERLHYVEHRAEYGERYLEEACREGWEGVIAKRAASTYTSGRSREWLKLKCGMRQELVIGGFTDPTGARSNLGALLVGHYQDGALHYAGKVGTGFDARTLADLGARLRTLEIAESPFTHGDPPTRGVHWVRPDLVAEVSFAEWTRDGRLRHPVFQGLRIDQPAKDVIRER